MSSHVHPAEEDRQPPDGAAADQDRLDSWKEIAAFLHRDVRTVQRWEKTAGLPVHRHAASRLRMAYAYRSELERWWRTQQVEPNGHEAATQPPAPAAATAGFPLPWRRAALAGALLVAVAAAVVLGAWMLRPGGSAAGTPAPPAPVPLLIAPLEDRASEPRLASLLDEAVARHLMQQRVAGVVPPAAVGRHLRLMRLDPGSRLTPAIAREIALRDGRIRFVLAGRLHALPSGYMAVLELTEPADGRVRTSVEAQGVSPDDLLAELRAQIGGLAGFLVAAASEPAPPAEPLERVTTASLPALRSYTAAVQAGSRRQWAAAELLARRAAEADPDFAAAHAWVAWAMRNQGRPRAECQPWAERAVPLAARATDRELYFSSGLLHDLKGELPQALAAYEALHRLQPQDALAQQLLVEGYARAGRMKEAGELAVSRAEATPGDFLANVLAARALAIWQGDRERAGRFVGRALQLRTPETTSEHSFWSAWLDALPVYDAWLSGDVASAAARLASLERGLEGRIGRERDALAAAVGFAYLALGRLERAEQVFRLASMPERQINLAMLALAVGDARRAREWLRQIPDRGSERPALFASAGLTAEAQRGLASAYASDHAEGLAAVTRGVIAARRGEADRAMAALRAGTELLRFSGEPEYFLGMEELARLWTARGRADQAARLLAEAAGQRGRTYGSVRWAAAYWLRLNVSQLNACRREGRHDEAERVRAELRRMLGSADAGHPFQVLIRAPRKAGAAAPAGRAAG